jgi:hypothetical protein
MKKSEDDATPTKNKGELKCIDGIYIFRFTFM